MTHKEDERQLHNELTPLTRVLRSTLAPAFHDTLTDFINDDEPEGGLAAVVEAARALAPTMPDALDILVLVADAYGAVAAAAKREVQRVSLERTTAERWGVVCREVMRVLLEEDNHKSVKTKAGFTVSRLEGRDKLIVTDIEAVPEEFARYTKSGDTRKALTHMKQTGELPPGFAWDRTPESLRITSPKS